MAALTTKAPPTFTTRDGAVIYFKDWGSGQPVLFSHGWPLTADAWDDQLNVVAANGFRGIAYDRRGHGRSSQPSDGNDMDTYADDIAALIETLGLNDVVLVGHSSGGGDITRYIGRHGTSRVAKVVLVSAIPPGLLKTDANPGGLPLSQFDDTRAGLTGDRSQFYRDIALAFYGANRNPGVVSQGVLDAFWLMCMQAGLKGAYENVKAFSESVFTEDLKRFDVPALIIHGEEDQLVPIANTAYLSSKIIPDATLKVYAGAPHVLMTTHKDTFNADLLDFLRS
jgi:non-heme chloroperoxidase